MEPLCADVLLLAALESDWGSPASKPLLPAEIVDALFAVAFESCFEDALLSELDPEADFLDGVSLDVVTVWATAMAATSSAIPKIETFIFIQISFTQLFRVAGSKMQPEHVGRSGQSCWFPPQTSWFVPPYPVLTTLMRFWQKISGSV